MERGGHPRRSSRPHRPSTLGGSDNLELVRGKKDLTPAAAQTLKFWMLDHFQNPYPAPAEKERLAHEAQITPRQLANWFTNARKRIWRPLREGSVASIQWGSDEVDMHGLVVKGRAGGDARDAASSSGGGGGGGGDDGGGGGGGGGVRVSSSSSSSSSSSCGTSNGGTQFVRGGHLHAVRPSHAAAAEECTDERAEHRAGAMCGASQAQMQAQASFQQQWQAPLQAQAQALPQDLQAWSAYAATAATFACNDSRNSRGGGLTAPTRTETSSGDSRRSIESHGSDSEHVPLVSKRLKRESHVARERAPSFGGFSAAAAAVAAPSAPLATTHTKEAAAILAMLSTQGASSK